MPIINFKKINTQQKIVIYIALIFVSLGAIIYFIIVPTINSINKNRADIIAQGLELEERYIRSKDLKRTKEKMNKIEPQIKLLDGIFINLNRELEFITTLEGIASQNNVLQKINLGSFESAISQPHMTISLNLIIEGKLSNIMSYLISLEALRYYINIKTITFRSIPGSKSPHTNKPQAAEDISAVQEGKFINNVSMAIDAETYWR